MKGDYFIMKKMSVVFLSICIAFIFTSCTSQKDLTPERANKIIHNWLNDENKKNSQINIVRLVKISDYSQQVQLKVKNFSWETGKVGSADATADFLFDKKWKMVKFTIGNCMFSCTHWDDLNITEQSAPPPSENTVEAVPAPAVPESKNIIVFQPGPEGFDTFYGTVYSEGPNENAQVLNYGGWGDYYYDYFRWDISSLPASSNVSKVLLYLFFNVANNDPAFNVQRVTESWDEASLTRSNNPSTIEFKSWRGIKNKSGWFAIDITELYKNWKDGTWPNYGIKLVPTANNNTNGNIISCENEVDPKLRPKLVITTK